MKCNLCDACVFNEPLLITSACREPRHCSSPFLGDVFGLDCGGFIVGTQIVHCDYFIQRNPYAGDVMLKFPHGYSVSYIQTKLHKGLGRLSDSTNQNIKIINYDFERKT